MRETWNLTLTDYDELPKKLTDKVLDCVDFVMGGDILLEMVENEIRDELEIDDRFSEEELERVLNSIEVKWGC